MGREEQARMGYSSVWIPLLAVQARKTLLCSQLCKPWSVKGISPTLSGCVFGGWAFWRCFAKCNTDIFRDLALF